MIHLIPRAYPFDVPEFRRNRRSHDSAHDTFFPARGRSTTNSIKESMTRARPKRCSAAKQRTAMECPPRNGREWDVSVPRNIFVCGVRGRLYGNSPSYFAGAVRRDDDVTFRVKFPDLSLARFSAGLKIIFRRGEAEPHSRGVMMFHKSRVIEPGISLNLGWILWSGITATSFGAWRRTMIHKERN